MGTAATADERNIMNAKTITAGTLSVVVAGILTQSLYFKFTNSVETQHIFGTLEQWGRSHSLGGFFSPKGPGGQYAVGIGELIASLLLLTGTFVPNLGRVQPVGALLVLGIMAGALASHLLTPLGVVVQGDGGLLFGMAAFNFVAAAVILTLRCHLLMKGQTS